MQRGSYLNDVDALSIGAWWKVEETNNFKWLHPKFKGLEDHTEKSHEIWEQLQDSFIQKIGLGVDQDKLTELKFELHEAISIRVLKMDRFLENRVQELELDISELEKKIYGAVSPSNEEVLEMLEDLRNRGDIDPFKMSVLKFHTSMKFHIEKVKKQNKRVA